MKIVLLVAYFLATVLANDIFLSSKKYSSAKGGACGKNAKVAVASTQNLDQLAVVLRRAHVTSAFVGGWEKRGKLPIRMTVSKKMAAVNEHDGNRKYRVVCLKTSSSKRSGHQKKNKGKNKKKLRRTVL